MAQDATSFSQLGFTLTPFQALTPSEAAAHLASYHHLSPTDKFKYRFQSHLVFPFVASIIQHPNILAQVRKILHTENILVWFTEWHVKPPSSSGLYTPHQDSTYAGLEPPEEVITVWVALTEVTKENGCLEFYPMHLYGGGRQLPHVQVTNDPNNLLLKGQVIPEEILEKELASALAAASTTTDRQTETLAAKRKATSTVSVELRPGEATIHAFRCVHASGPNRSEASPRIGLAIRYTKTSVRQTGPSREGAVLVSGEDLHRHFDLRPLPMIPFDPQSCAFHEKEMAIMQQNYLETSHQTGKERG